MTPSTRADARALADVLKAIIQMDDDARDANGKPGANLNGVGLVDLFDCVNHPFGSGEHKQQPYRSNQLEGALSDARAVITALRNSAPQETRGDEPVELRTALTQIDTIAVCVGVVDARLFRGMLANIADIARTALRAAPQQSPRLEREALKAAEQELTDLARPICCVYNRAIKKYEFSDAHIAQALPGTFEVIKQIRAALLSPDTTVVSSTDHSAVDAIAVRSPGVSKATIRNLLDAELCDDCPPRGHPTDKTRCRVCPRVSSKNRGAV